MAEWTPPKKICRPRDDLVVERIEDDLLVLDKRNQKVHQLNTTASAVWEKIKDGQDPERTAREIVALFDIAPEVALQDVIQIVDEFISLGLLEDAAAE